MGLLAGLQIQKEDKKEDKKATKEKEKKAKKKEKRKEAKKRKKEEKTAKAAQASSSDSSDAEGEQRPDSAKPAKAAAAEVEPEPAAPAQPADDFFSMATSLTASKLKKDKPDPDRQIIHEREYNPFLRGEKSDQPQAVESGAIPKHLQVGDGGAAWRKRAQKRQAQTAREEGDAEEEPPEDKPRQAPARGGGGGPAWRRRARERQAQKAGDEAADERPERGRAARSPRRDRSRSRSRRATRSRSRRRARSRSRRAARPRSRSWENRPKRSAAQRSSSPEEPARSPPAAKREAAEAERRTREAAAREADEAMQRLQSKYSKEDLSSAAQEAEAAASEQAKQDDDPEDANALGALAMEAMLAGDMARYEQLNKRLEERQAAQAAAGPVSTGTADGVPELPPSKPAKTQANVKVLEEVDAAGRKRSLVQSVESGPSVRTKGRNKRGTANAVPSGAKNEKDAPGFYEDDKVSLDDLIKRERITGVQDYDSNLTSHILKKGSKFKMLDEEEDEAYALGWYESKEKKMDSRRAGDKQRQKEVRDKQRVQMNLEQCTFCWDSKRFDREATMISSSSSTYLCMDNFKDCVLPGQMFIAPKEHTLAMTDVDEDVFAEIRNYQKCLVRFFESQDPPKAPLFVETVVHKVNRDEALLGKGPHARIVVFPVDLDTLHDARLFWKKAFDEAENEFETQHKKVIETDGKRGVREKVPKNFPYVHVDFSLGGGYAHIVDNVLEFPRNFVRDTVAGMCELTVLDRAYRDKQDHKHAAQEMRKKFADGFDWTTALKG